MCFAALSSAFGLVYSQLLVKTLVGLTSSFLIAQTVTLGCYIAAMGVGSYLADRVEGERIPRWLPRLQLVLAIAGMVLVLFVYGIYIFEKFYAIEITDLRERLQLAALSRGLILGVQPLSCAIGLVAGLELNLFMRWARARGEEAAAARILAGSYAGTIVASLVFIWLMPALMPQSTSLAMAALNLLFSLALAWAFRRGEPLALLRHVGVSLVASMLLAWIAGHAADIEQIELKAREMQGIQVFQVTDLVRLVRELMPQRPPIWRYNTRYQNAEFVFNADGGYRFYLETHPQLDRAWVQLYHEGLIDMPIQFYRQVPRRVLILGGGDGIAAGQVLRYGERVEVIDDVELDPWMIAMARTNPFFLSLNHDAFNTPKVHVHNDDAVMFLRQSSSLYDAIFIDFPLPFEADLVKLFSVEFYSLVARHLADNGMVVLDAPLGCFRPDPFDHGGGRWRSGLLRTLREAGFKNLFTYCSGDGFVVARRDTLAPALQYMDMGVTYSRPGPDLFKTERLQRPAPLRTDFEGEVNSIFQPFSPSRSHDL
jgi:spermidine synthase